MIAIRNAWWAVLVLAALAGCNRPEEANQDVTKPPVAPGNAPESPPPAPATKAEMKPKYDLFLSHNSADKPWAERLATAIEADTSGPRLRVFFDKWDIPPGGDVPLELEEGLQSSRYVGLVLSPEALASDWVSLERSTAIYRDPRARSQHLIPLLRRTCSIPDMFARINHIDFRREQDFDAGLSKLINVLRGRPMQRGGSVDPADVHFREDADLLRQHRRIFARPAFRVSCVRELFLREILEAIDDTAAAINTGSLYSRSQKLLSSFPDANEYRLPEFKQAFSRITAKLTQLKRAVIEFEEYFRGVNPSYSHHRNFYAMIMSFRHKASKTDVRTLVTTMDRIDTLRNDILSELNVLLSKCGEETFDSIELSSDVLKKGQIGGADSIAPLL